MKNFTPVPNDWIDSLANGRLTPPMYAILSYLMRTCKWKSGVWRGEAERIAYHLNRAWSVRQINRYITRLHECGYVTGRTFRAVAADTKSCSTTMSRWMTLKKSC